MAATAIIAAVAIGTTAYSVDASNDARQDAEDQQKDAKNKQDELDRQMEVRQEQENEKTRTLDKQEEGRQKRRRAMGGTSDRSSTILTSPLGITDAPAEPLGKKTILGG